MRGRIPRGCARHARPRDLACEYGQLVGHRPAVSSLSNARIREREGPMVTQKQSFADAAMLTIGLEQLDEVLRQPGATPREVIAAEFDRLEELVAALPL